MSVIGIEEKSNKRRRKNNIKKLVLETVIVSGVLGVALVAPQVLVSMKKLGLLPSNQQKSSINRTRDKLMKQGLLIKRNGLLSITPKGRVVLRKIKIMEEGLLRPRRWDGNWRIIIFNIPNYRRGLRFKIRRSLRAVGFVRLQDSVWVYPYPCEEFTALLKADFKVGKDMLYVIAESIEGDEKYKKLFNLES